MTKDRFSDEEKPKSQEKALPASRRAGVDDSISSGVNRGFA
jgi:hypothetical protein